MPRLMQTVSSYLCLPGPPISSCKPHWTNTISCLAKFFEIRKEQTKLQDDDQLVLRPHVLLEYPTLPKTMQKFFKDF